jgi:exonuclease III
MPGSHRPRPAQRRARRALERAEVDVAPRAEENPSDHTPVIVDLAD